MKPIAALWLFIFLACALLWLAGQGHTPCIAPTALPWLACDGAVQPPPREPLGTWR